MEFRGQASSVAGDLLHHLLSGHVAMGLANLVSGGDSGAGGSRNHLCYFGSISIALLGFRQDGTENIDSYGSDVLGGWFIGNHMVHQCRG